MLDDKETVSKLRESKKPVLIYGNMGTSELVYDYLVGENIFAESFAVDEPYWSEGESCKNLPVKKISDYADSLDKYNLVIGFCNVNKTKILLNNPDLLRCGVYLISRPCMGGGTASWKWDESYINRSKNKFDEIRKNFNDDLSRKTLDALIEANSGNFENLLKVSEDNQYFNRLTFEHCPEKEVYADCGAFNGDTVKKYYRFTDGRYKKIFAFEPMHSNLKILRKNVSGMHDVNIIEKGVWNRCADLSFVDNGSSSSFSEDNTGEKIPVVTMDSVLKGEKVTFIKMDIEGTEREALHGARMIIERDMPKLAICVYHKPNDLIDIYDFLQSLSLKNKYLFYLRHHSNNTSETVLYAVPT